jgi:hypothetical protein
LLVACADIVVCDETVEVESLLMSTEECVDNVLSDTIVENVDGCIEVPTVVIG